MKILFPLALLFILLSSHELFLKSDSYFLKSSMPSEIYLLNGTFDESENVITRDRIIDATIRGPQYEFSPMEKDYYDRDNVTYLKWTTGKPGTYVAGISTLPRKIQLNARDFNEYLEHEGLTNTIEDRKAKGISDRPAIEKYSKHVKAVLQVEKHRTDDYAQVLGYPIEFIPLTNPYELSVGDEFRMKLIYEDSPLPDQVVHISSRPGMSSGSNEEMETRSDSKGEISLIIDQKGKWYIATIYMQESNEKGLDYESNWATLTFEVK